MRLIAVSGFKDTGKSTLCRALLGRLKARGFRVGYIKRTQEFVASEPNTDSGAACGLGVDALLWGEGSFRYESTSCDFESVSPAEVASRFFPDADVVILEGGKEMALPKIWVLEPDGEKPDYPGIFALYDRFGSGNGAERYGADEIDRLASDIAAKISRVRRSVRAYIGDRELPMKDFVADFVGGGVKGMLRSLKGFCVGDVRVYIRDEDDFS